MFLTAREASDLVSNPGSTQNALFASAKSALVAALVSNLHSFTINIAGKSGSDVVALIQSLKQNGYTLFTSGTNLTFSW